MRKVSKNFSYEVKARSYSSKVRHVGADYIVMDRIHHNKKNTYQIDSYGPVWIVGFSDMADNISIKNGSEFIELKGPSGFFAPPFSILKWKIKPGVFKWTATVSNEALPKDFYTQPFVFQWNQAMPNNLNELLELVSKSKKTSIEIQSIKSPTAENLKNFIDTYYRENLNIGEIAKKLNLSWSYMTREFRKTYDLSPIEYRHRVRIFNSIKMLSMGISVTEACLNSGFTSINQYNLHFKKYLGATPLSYSIEKNPTKKLL